MALIEVRGIEKKYQMGENLVQALRGVTLSIEAGEFVAIMGPSGSGKSTLMHILGLLDVPDGGSYLLAGREIAGLSEDELAVLRRDTIGFIFQQFNLLPRMTAAENVALPLLYQGRLQEGAPYARELLAKVGLGARMEHRPNELSGGQQQRVAIARSLINRPRIIFADEPTGNLDSHSEREIMAALRELNRQGITVVIVTHEEEIGRQAQRIIRIRDGQVQADERAARPGDEPAPPGRAPDALPASAGARAPGPEDRAARPVREALEYFRQGVRTLAANKVRTALSMLGILIGVAAVVAMLALGRGAQTAIEAQLSSLGSNLLVLRPGAVQAGGVRLETGATTRLTVEDAAALQSQVANVRVVAPGVSGRGQVTYLNRNWNTQVQGVMPAYARIHASQPEVGRFFTDEENQRRARVAVIGATLVRELFQGQNPVGEAIKINRISFTVIGVLPEKGANGFRDQDDVIAIPLQTAMHRLMGKAYVDTIEIESADAASIDAVQEDALQLMTRRHRVPPSQQRDAFQIRNMAELQAALSESSRTMSALLASIAAISLLVGGIGIMNIMLVSVTERTREIGLRKAVGARRRDILLQFMSEAVAVSGVGGLAGIALGWTITEVLSRVAGWSTSVSPEAVALAFAFSASIGVVFGIYPARKASLLHPIEALRHE